jgi:hypothetical protein
MDVQAPAALREDGSSMAIKSVFDGEETTAAALRHDSFENEKVSIARGRITHERSGAPYFVVAAGANDYPRRCLRSEMVVPVDELRMPHENELDELAAFVARRKLLTRDARDLVRVGVLPVVKDGINPRFSYLVARLEHANTLFGPLTLRPKVRPVKLLVRWTARDCWRPLWLT